MGAARATQSAPARSPSPSSPRESSSSSSSSAQLRDARVSSILSGQNLYRMSDGRIIELPEGMTAAEAAKLEADAKTAQQKLGKGPAPKPVPQVKKAADKTGKKGAAQPQGKQGKGGAGGKGGPRTGSRSVSLKTVGGKVAKFLLGKAAPVLQRGVALLRTLSKNEQTHDDAAKKVTQAEKAVVNPPSEGQSKSNTGQVQSVEGRPAPPVDPAKGKETLQQSLSENVPKSIEDVDNFKRDMKGQHIGTDVLKVVQGDKNSVVSTFSDMEKTPAPAPPEQVPENLPAPEAAPATGGMDLGQGAIAPLQPEHTDVSNFTNEADAKLTEEGVTQEQLDMVDSGDLASANKEKKGMETMAKAEPLAINKLAQDQKQSVDRDLKQEEKKERGALTAKRKGGLNGAAQKQKKAKSDLEKKREEVAAKINGIYKTAQDKVKKKLADLETLSMKRFDDGNAVATKAFEADVNREIDAFKDDRYSGLFGWARKAKDWLLGMDDLPEVKAIFDRNKAKFVTTIDRLVADIGADNKRVIQECKDDLARAKTEIKEYVDKLGPSLKDIGQKTAGDVNRQLEEMDGFIRKKEEELQQKLADKQQAAIKAIDEKIEKMKDAMSGALAKLGKLLLYAAKKFFTWALGKFGYSLGDIEGIINKGAAALKAIFTKPMVFVKNLVNAAIQGFKNFGKNFLKHLKNALFEWLTGSLDGLKLPTVWDFQGVVGLALQMIGITYANVRKHLVNELGETAVTVLEKSFTLVKTLITEGPMAAWEQLKEMAAEMRDAFIDAIKDFIKTKIIEQAVIWIVSLFVPGAGILKAIIGIYDTVMFFVQKAKQIATMISNFLGSMGEIAAGNIGAAATAMEMGLARGLSLVISFLAKLLRLDGITAKIRAGIQKIYDKVQKILAKVAKWIGDKAKALIGGIKKGAAKLANWWKREKKFSADGESHRLFFAGDAKGASLRVASDEKSLDQFLSGLPADKKKLPEYIAIDNARKAIEKQRKTRKPPTPDGVAPGDDTIEANFTIIGNNLPALFSGDKWGTDTNPVLMVYPKKALSLYRTLYLGPKVKGRMAQSILKDAPARKSRKKVDDAMVKSPISGTAKALEAWIEAGGVVKTYKPFVQTDWPDGKKHGGTLQLGVAPNYMAQAGTTFKYDKDKTPGGKKLNNELREFGYVGAEKGGENSDGDHILEAQLIGRDASNVIPNMWPLAKKENRHGLSLEEKADISVAKPALTFVGLGKADTSTDKKKVKDKLRVMIKSNKETTP